ncbi:MAG: 50S ribosomal protein L21 [Candidatus Taylorbacteria bacterium RIFCSPHIGHO2_02_FULL_47_18]|uniref:Large ribosomal subunit protein bL21 n=1 Tax=Candidatus Taylorbacteria bacterium RIFCSPLOWO2_01_FULL_48_100 TaxID=1802322 RepID=A0A1G2NF80_9BACT|nr:MAG: 50S ribosomal protein L21 [Candidatus Taylorbacteria bacterium RIFCSPHIGHO2_01_FULL_48_38]OHA27643.1 MAG: 50S ribosomal protein L21 [Candidatus Taylorbacteria bacterium RIFCSPHIGHO2_02_FULL_47_18]OHA34002.1 MAG: 50S ribosomal protein L21 [Candidatus Taylorbacteria bacterium RIFCSPLOWO2_01_FULL_48_100]OHA40489.1 MAG: 50S ribosomal protein L21 [Candidatus Taylorbacteria bacterium RIFCSPLOWO2_02_FULL_48_16]OHA44950.1 MAG: 50S ribosomal protein L21 [Candidatus Taylorbacteria bacterium RIFCS
MKPFAIIETGGKQYRASEGETVKIEKIPALRKGAEVLFDKVLLTDDGAQTTLGAPYIAGAKVKGEITEEGRNRKVEVVKYKAKSRYFKLRGHRQPFMKVKITGGF